MSVLGMGPMEILVVLVIAFIVLGPDKMVTAARMLGRATGELRRMAEGLPQLTLEDEQQWTGTIAECADQPDEFSDLSIMVFLRPDEQPN